MDKLSCQQIDAEFLVEQYVAGKLTGELRDRFEEHIAECAEHAQAISLEKVFRRGVREFARSEIKSRIMSRAKKREDIRVLVLRFAAFLFVAVITPLILYYQFGIFQKEDKIAQVKILSDSDKTSSGPAVLERKMQETSATASTEKAGKALDENVAAQPESKGSGKTVTQPEQIIAENEVPLSKAEEPQPAEAMRLEARSQVQSKDVSLTRAKQVAGSKESLIVSTGTVTETIKPTVMVFSSDNTLQPDVAEKISPQMGHYEPEIHDCLKKFLVGNGDRYCQLSIEFVILPDGKTRSAKVLKTNIDLKESENCILEKINNWTFPAIDSEYRVLTQYCFELTEE
jgi:hypothetical protein